MSKGRHWAGIGGNRPHEREYLEAMAGAMTTSIAKELTRFSE